MEVIEMDDQMEVAWSPFKSENGSRIWTSREGGRCNCFARREGKSGVVPRTTNAILDDGALRETAPQLGNALDLAHRLDFGEPEFFAAGEIRRGFVRKIRLPHDTSLMVSER